ncbi:MAG: M20/M25/M40 family metallo-hydrolase [Proteobacteria bacterium]|nr:M20/M25/M40 family metallo-hydrolase [Burkholderiales bacterium]
MSTPVTAPTPATPAAASPQAKALARTLAATLSYERVRTILQELVRVPSPQTALLEDEPQLREFIRVALVPRMSALGFTRVRQDSMGNLIAELGPAHAARTLMLVMHAMNQPPSTMPDPYGATLIDGTPHGLPGEAVLGKGASEQKGTMAAILHAIEAVRDAAIGLDGRLVLLCLVSGETGKPDAIKHVIEHEGVRADVAFVYGNAMQLQLGNRGRVDVNVTVHGAPCHSSRPNEGANAIVGAVELLRRLGEAIPNTRAHPGLGTAWLTCNGIESFPKSTHTVQGQCIVRLDQRLLPGDDPALAVAAIERVARTLDDWPDPISGKPFRCVVEAGAYMYPSLVTEDSLPARLLQAGCSAMLEREVGTFYGQSAHDQGYLNHAGIPTANFGPGEQSLAHTDNDMASVDKTFDAARVYAWVIAGYLGAAPAFDAGASSR